MWYVSVPFLIRFLKGFHLFSRTAECFHVSLMEVINIPSTADFVEPRSNKPRMIPFGYRHHWPCVTTIAFATEDYLGAWTEKTVVIWTSSSVAMGFTTWCVNPVRWYNYDKNSRQLTVLFQISSTLFSCPSKMFLTRDVQNRLGNKATEFHAVRIIINCISLLA